MRKLLILLTAFVLAIGFWGTSEAFNVDLYVDSAPNAYGSPNYAPWWSQTKTDVVAGAFTNLRTGTFPGTTLIDPYDEIVYSTGDLGKRLHWVYWIPGETTSSLNGLFQAKQVMDWDGVDYAWGADVDGPEVGWYQPSKWENYNDGLGNTGVIGTFGNAWWATDNDAEPYDTGGGPYDETDQADIDALRAQVFQSQTYSLGMVRYRPTTGDEWQYTNLNTTVVPEPVSSTLFLLGAATMGVRGYLRRKKR